MFLFRGGGGFLGPRIILLPTIFCRVCYVNESIIEDLSMSRDGLSSLGGRALKLTLIIYEDERLINLCYSKLPLLPGEPNKLSSYLCQLNGDAGTLSSPIFGSKSSVSTSQPRISSSSEKRCVLVPVNDCSCIVFIVTT